MQSHHFVKQLHSSSPMRHGSRGFTILEIIIVVVILSVLVALALPRFIAVIEHSRVTEALMMLTEARSIMEQGYLMNNNQYSVISLANFIAYTNTNPGRHFEYVGGFSGPTTYIIFMARTTYELKISDPGGGVTCGSSSNGNIGRSQIAACVELGTGKFKIRGSGFYSDIDIQPQ